jgi:hypothetical protein
MQITRGMIKTPKLTPLKQSERRWTSVDAISPDKEQQNKQDFDDFVNSVAKLLRLDAAGREKLAQDLRRKEKEREQREQELKEKAKRLENAINACKAREDGDDNDSDSDCIIDWEKQERRAKARAERHARKQGNGIDSEERKEERVVRNQGTRLDPIDLELDDDMHVKMESIMMKEEGGFVKSEILVKAEQSQMTMASTASMESMTIAEVLASRESMTIDEFLESTTNEVIIHNVGIHEDESSIMTQSNDDNDEYVMPHLEPEDGQEVPMSEADNEIPLHQQRMPPQALQRT